MKIEVCMLLVNVRYNVKDNVRKCKGMNEDTPLKFVCCLMFPLTFNEGMVLFCQEISFFSICENISGFVLFLVVFF